MTSFHKRRQIMVDTQVRPSDVTSLPIINAMLNVPREQFLPVERAEAAYMGDNVVIAPGRVMLAPRTFAKMVEAAQIGADDVVMVVGAGYGYSAAVLQRISKRVVALEEDTALNHAAEEALTGYGADHIAGPLALGAKSAGPFDVILIEGAVEQVPEALGDQLSPKGRIVAIFAEGHLGTCKVAHKFDGQLEWRAIFTASAPVLQGFERAPSFAL
ncbi:MAG: protein-L-isoaspartate O-methyltransferase [Deltaproteobacteria bacterium]